jgi:hypothetical protein
MWTEGHKLYHADLQCLLLHISLIHSLFNYDGSRWDYTDPERRIIEWWMNTDLQSTQKQAVVTFKALPRLLRETE